MPDKNSNGTDDTRDIDLILDERDVYYSYSSNTYNTTKFDKNLLSAYLNTSKEIHKYDSLYAGLMNVKLDEITVKAKKINRDNQIRKERNMIYSRYDNRIELDSFITINPNWTIYDLVNARVPGVQVLGSRATGQKFRIRSSSSINLSTTAQVMLDGMPISDDLAANISVQDVEFVDILRGLSSTSVFGAAGANGIVAVYLRKDRLYRVNQESTRYKNRINMTGYHLAREFYTPDYSKNFAGKEKPDFRTTLFWKPNIYISKTGKTQIQFYTSDAITEYLIDVQGITSDGRPFTGKSHFVVKK